MTKSVFLTDDHKYYRWPPAPKPEQEIFDRVTHVIGSGEPQFWMKPWVAKMISTYVADNWYEIGCYFGRPGGDVDEGIALLKRVPDTFRDAAAVRGTDVHDIAERLASGEEVDVPEHLVAHVDACIQFFEDFNPEFEYIEGTVYNRALGYAGSFDGIAIVGNKRVLIDYKTSDKGIKENIALQLAAYKYAEFIGGPDGSEIAMPDIDECWGVSITAKGYKVIPVTVNDTVFDAFKNVRYVAYWTEELRKTVLGKALDPPESVERGASTTPDEGASTPTRPPESVVDTEGTASTSVPSISDALQLSERRAEKYGLDIYDIASDLFGTVGVQTFDDINKLNEAIESMAPF